MSSLRIRQVNGSWYLTKEWKSDRKSHSKNIEKFGKQKPILYIPILLQGDINKRFNEIPHNSIDIAIADPPYNLNFDYGKDFNDNQKISSYVSWTGDWISLLVQKLRNGGSFYYINYPRQCAYVQTMLLDKLMTYRKTITWCYESNVGMSPTNLTTASRHILFYTKGDGHTFNGEKIAIPYRNPDDKRIKKQMAGGKKGKTPYDHWFFNLAKNVSKQKITNIVKNGTTPPNQLPEDLIKRIIQLSSNRGDVVLSLFTGSGTDLAVCCDLDVGRKCIGIELNPDYCNAINQRVNQIFNKQISNLEIKTLEDDFPQLYEETFLEVK